MCELPISGTAASSASLAAITLLGNEVARQWIPAISHLSVLTMFSFPQVIFFAFGMILYELLTRLPHFQRQCMRDTWHFKCLWRGCGLTVQIL
jgi:hypothetical protein